VPTHAPELAGIGVTAGSDDSGSFETTPEPAPSKGGIDVGNSLADLARTLYPKDLTPPTELASSSRPLFEQAGDQRLANVQDPPSVKFKHESRLKPIPTTTVPPKAIPIAGPPEKTEPSQTTSPSSLKLQASNLPAYSALKNLATTLRIIPAFLIPVVLWHVLTTVTISGMIVTLVTGTAIVAMTWTLAEIADTVRDIARRPLPSST